MHKVVPNILLCLQMVSKLVDDVLESLDSVSCLRLDGFGFVLGSGMALLLNGNSLAEDLILLYNSFIV